MARLPAARRGLGTDRYGWGLPEKTIPATLRYANLSTTNPYYIKSAAEDRRAAMAKLEKLVIGNAEATNLQSDNPGGGMTWPTMPGMESTRSSPRTRSHANWYSGKISVAWPNQATLGRLRSDKVR
jgi:hypothetical protein